MTRTVNSIKDINLKWLQDTLGGQEEFIKDGVIDLNVKKVGEGIGQLGEFALLETTRESGKKTNIFAKLQTQTEDMDNLAKDYKFYIREVRFYEFLAKSINVKTPKAYYVEYNPENERVVLLLEYMDGWYNPDQIKGATEKEIEVAINGLIPISTQFWGTIQEIDWVPNMKVDYMLRIIDDMRDYSPEFLNRFSRIMNGSRKANLNKIVEFYPNFPDLFTQGTLTLNHWDYRVENLFFTPEVDDITVIDWQLMMAHLPGWDLAYLLFTNIEVDLRRKIYTSCCRQYLDGLSKEGIHFLEEDLERNMMLSLLAMTNFPVIGGANADKENERSIKLFEVLGERIFSAIEDYDAMKFIS
tara:strand:+ start:4301 stop:5368 length:1068 start_codon:yes stop_codon:yes gene_type:complete